MYWFTSQVYLIWHFLIKSKAPIITSWCFQYQDTKACVCRTCLVWAERVMRVKCILWLCAFFKESTERQEIKTKANDDLLMPFIPFSNFYEENFDLDSMYASRNKEVMLSTAIWTLKKLVMHFSLASSIFRLNQENDLQNRF